MFFGEIATSCRVIKRVPGASEPRMRVLKNVDFLPRIKRGHWRRERCSRLSRPDRQPPTRSLCYVRFIHHYAHSSGPSDRAATTHRISVVSLLFLCFHLPSETRLRVCVRGQTRAYGSNTMSVKHARRYPAPVCCPWIVIPLNARLIFCCCERPSKTSNALGRVYRVYRRPYILRDNIMT